MHRGGRISAFGVATSGLGQNLEGESLRLNLPPDDVFKTARVDFDTGNENYHVIGLRHPRMRQVSATLTYSFGQQRHRWSQQPDMQIRF